MARRVFFSFHYQRDIWRVNQVRMSNMIAGAAAAGFHDASLWEEAKRKSDAAVHKLIDDGLKNTSVTVVCIGGATAGRKFINYEINQSLARGNVVLGLRIHHLKDKNGKTDSAGEIPALLTKNKIAVKSFTTADDLGNWVEAAAKAAGKA